jgi:hypothetical protein
MCFLNFSFGGFGGAAARQPPPPPVAPLPIHVMETRRENRSMAPPTLNLGAGWKCVVNFTPRPIDPTKSPRYPLNMRLGGPQSWSGRFREQKNLSPLMETEPRTAQPVANHYTDCHNRAASTRGKLPSSIALLQAAVYNQCYQHGTSPHEIRPVAAK